MTIRRTSRLAISRMAAEIGFYVLFPAFFFYNLGASAGVITRIAGGLFGWATVILAVVFAFNVPTIIATCGRSGKNVLFVFVLLLVYCSSWVLINYYFTNAEYREQAAFRALAMLCAWFALFMIGILLPLESCRFRSLLVVWLLAMAITTFILFDRDTMMFYANALYDVFDDGGATYQGYSRSALLTSLFVLAMYSSFRIKALIVVVSICLLFLLGTRSDFFGFIALVAVLLVLHSSKSATRLIAMIVLASGAGTYFAAHVTDLSGSRQLEVLSLDQSDSWQVRKALEATAIKQISESPLLGVYSGSFQVGATLSYAHNALSAWVEFGAVGFLLYVGLVIYCAFFSFRRYILESFGATAWSFPFYVNFVALLLILSSHPVFWTVPALGWGLVINALVREKLVMRYESR